MGRDVAGDRFTIGDAEAWNHRTRIIQKFRPEFSDDLVPGEEPQAIADRILSRFRRGTDDALVLVVRCLGDQS